MKIFLICMSLVIGSFLAKGQEINFSTDLNWTALNSKAKADHKYIFLDFFATWCGPCKYMADSVFTKKDVQRLMNSEFVSYPIQTDQTPNDNSVIKKKYSETAMLMKSFNIRALPTLIILSPRGDVIDRTEGSFENAEGFLTWIKKTLDPKEQYYKQLEIYYEGKKDKLFLMKLLELASQAGDKKMVAEINMQLLRTY